MSDDTPPPEPDPAEPAEPGPAEPQPGEPEPAERAEPQPGGAQPGEPDTGEPGTAPAAGRRWSRPLVVLAAVTALLSVASFLVRDTGRGGSVGPDGWAGSQSPPASTGGRYYACLSAGDADEVARQAADCARIGREVRRRGQPAGVSAAVRLAMTDIDGVLGRVAGECETGQRVDPGCPPARPATVRPEPSYSTAPDGTRLAYLPAPRRPPPQPVTAAQVALAARAVREAGLVTALVRLARADDPAPAGAIIYALPAGPDCIVGYWLDLTTAAGPVSGPMILGQLSDGTCLPR